MTINRGTIFQRQPAEPSIPVSDATILGIIGTSDSFLSPTNSNIPVAVSSEEEADNIFGTGSLIDGIKTILSQQRVRVVAVGMDPQYSEWVQSIQVTAGGTGYTDVPTVVITGSNTTPATAIAEVSGGAVTVVNIISRGDGYSAPPAITFTGGGGAGAAATAVMGTREDSAIDALDGLRNAESLTGLVPNMLIGNGECISRGAGGVPLTTSSPAFAKLGAMAIELQAGAYADCPWTNDVAALAWKGNNEHNNIISCFPRQNHADVTSEIWGSAIMGGITAREDQGIDGIAHSPDNKVAQGVTPGSVIVPYSEDPSSVLHTLEAAGILTFIYRNGVRTFGGQTSGTGVYSEMPVVRIAYKIDKDTKEIADEYRGRRNVGSFISTVNGRFQDYFDALVVDGLIASGVSQPDSEYNDLQANVENARLKFDFEVEVVIGTKLITLSLNTVV